MAMVQTQAGLRVTKRLHREELTTRKLPAAELPAAYLYIFYNIILLFQRSEAVVQPQRGHGGGVP